MQCIAQGVMESVVSNSFCITISGWDLVAWNASPNVAYSTISACRCRQMRPFASSSPRIVLSGGSPLRSGHFLRHLSLHDCARTSLHSPGAQWKLPLGYFFWCTYQSSYFCVSTPICSCEFAAHLSRLLLACKNADQYPVAATSRVSASSSLIFACIRYYMRSGGLSALTILLCGSSSLKSSHVFYPMPRAGYVFIKNTQCTSVAKVNVALVDDLTIGWLAANNEYQTFLFNV